MIKKVIKSFIQPVPVFNSATCKFSLASCTQYSKFGNVIRNIQNKLCNRALKSDLKSTVTLKFYPIESLSCQSLYFTDSTYLSISTFLISQCFMAVYIARYLFVRAENFYSPPFSASIWQALVFYLLRLNYCIYNSSTLILVLHSSRNCSLAKYFT